MLKARRLLLVNLEPLYLLPSRQFSEHVVPRKKEGDLFTKLPPESMNPKRVAPIRGYLYLPGNQDMAFPQYLRGPTEDFPIGVQCNTRETFTLDDWAQALREFTDEFLPKYKGILFRGVPLADGVSFNNLIQKIGYSSLAYKFGTDRRHNVASDVYGPSNEPPPFIIEMHNEASYSPFKLIRKIFFFCQNPAPFGLGGETPVCKTNRFMKDIDQNFIAKLRSKKLRYLRMLADRQDDPEMCWQRLMHVETREEAEADMKKLNFGWRWNANGSLTSWYTKPAFMNHPDNGEELWFNQATTHHRSYYDHMATYLPSSNFEDYPGGCHTQYGDGEELEEEYLQQVRNITWQETVGVQLEAGDVLVLDNLACQHGRMNYHGPRKIFLSLTAD